MEIRSRTRPSSTTTDVAGAGVADQQSFMDVPCLADRIGGVVGGCGRGGRGDGQAGGQRGEQESV